LYKSFREDQTIADIKYNNKMITVSGILDDVDRSEKAVIAYFILDEGLFGPEGVRIIMLNGQENLLIKRIGQPATIRGLVLGYNQTDIVLSKGSLIE
jgi:hypothetical protein